MGYYLETDNAHDKAKDIANTWNGRIVRKAPSFQECESVDECAIAVKSNGPFEAAGICYNEREHKEFCGRIGDTRATQFVILSKANTVAAYAHRALKDDSSVDRLAQLLGVEKPRAAAPA